VYPNAVSADTTTLYEDDTASTGYESGQYRTTALSVSTDAAAKKVTVGVAPAKGSFTGPKAFDTRNYTVRLHKPAGFGNVISVKNAAGQTVPYTTVARDGGAMPFMLSGGAADADIIEIVVSNVVVSAGMTLTVEFGSVTPNAKPDVDYDVPGLSPVPVVMVGTQYNTTAPTAANVDLTAEGTADWIIFGTHGPGTSNRKNTANQSLWVWHRNSSTNMKPLNNYNIAFSYTDGGNSPFSASNVRNGMFNDNTGGSYEIVAAPGTAAQREMTLYLGGQGQTKLELLDYTTGSVVATHTFQNTTAPFAVPVKVSFGAAGLRLRYSLVSGSNASIAAATLK
jgi:hypothetical protein